MDFDIEEIDGDELELFIQEHWGDRFSYPLDFGEVISNYGSDNIIFDSEEEKFVFRIIYTEPDAIHNGSQIYEYLHSRGLPVPLPIKTDSDEYVVDAWDEENEQMIGYSIHTFVEGEEEIDKSSLGEVLPEMGKWFGKLHTALSKLEIDQLDLRGITKEQMQEALEVKGVGFSDTLLAVPREHPLVIEMFNFWNDWREETNMDQLLKGFIHGDMGPGANILMKDGKVTGLIDLIDVGSGYYIQDIGSFAMYAGLYQEEHQDWLELFKRSYLEHGPIDEEEFELLPYFVLWRFLINALYFDWRLRNGYNQGVDDEEDNEEGFQDALWMLDYWKKRYAELMK